MYDIFEKLCEQNKVTPYRVCKETGITTATISNWKAGRYVPKQDKMKKIADYFGVTVDYLMTGKEGLAESEKFNARDRRDITKDLDRIMGEIRNEEDGPLFYNGQPLDPEDMIFLSKAIEAALMDAKKKNKVTYNPNKNKTKK
ncbi:helix-turn-helix transcriptional regulator [Clostridium sp. HBUAS56010]|uniref:helix-turn-helix domain-containing protein n=1 Tax=Clostridium sp. HBUAS56010 TaxID=2571127 RepID=UPI0011776AFB|nr:helix-turn-helix transcriptional regulator [Clostridium sp. HBUAS56010]